MPPRRKNKGRRFEKRVQRTIGSGNVWFAPLDLNYEKYCIEAKYTDKKGYRVACSLLEKIWNQSLEMNKEPVLVIGIKRNDKEVFMLQCNINIEKKEGISNV